MNTLGSPFWDGPSLIAKMDRQRHSVEQKRLCPQQAQQNIHYVYILHIYMYIYIYIYYNKHQCCSSCKPMLAKQVRIFMFDYLCVYALYV